MVQRLLEAIHCHLLYDSFKPVLKQCTAKALKTDMCILTGHHTVSPYAEYWTQTYRANNFVTIRENGDLCLYSPLVKNPAVRPIEYPNFLPKEVLENCVHTEKINGHDVKIVQYGAFPQSVVNRKISAELEEAYQTKKIKETGNAYSFDAQNSEFVFPDEKPVFEEYPEYQWGENFYIRFVPCKCGHDTLTAGQQIQYGQPYWVRVEAIDWLLNETNGTPDMMIARHALVSGIAINNRETYEPKHPENWKKTLMYDYLINQFEREIKQHDVLRENIVPNKAITRLAIRQEREEKYSVLAFVSFAVKRMAYETFSMNRFQYFKTLTALKKEFLKINGNDMFPRHIEELDKYIKEHIRRVMNIEKMTPFEAVQELSCEIMKKKGIWSLVVSLSNTGRRVQCGYANPLINPLALINNDQKERE